jgi:hypothetical protein
MPQAAHPPSSDPKEHNPNSRWQEDLGRHPDAQEIPFSLALVIAGRTVHMSATAAYLLVQENLRDEDLCTRAGSNGRTRACPENVRSPLTAASSEVAHAVQVNIFNTNNMPMARSTKRRHLVGATISASGQHRRKAHTARPPRG